MTGSSRPGLHVGLAGASFALPAVAVALPWLQVAGEPRNGLASAELLVSVTAAGAPEGLRVVGIVWYVGAFAALAAWGVAVTVTGRRSRSVAIALSVLGLSSWAVFVAWAGTDTRVLMRWPGPTLGLLGMSLLTVAAFVGSPRNRSAEATS
ncbi:MAG: hypothetical protein ACE367_25915 [Acidimicrobiales bacterium]